jgi:RNA polymerase sigma-70 factor, ECF subfamily
MERTACDLTQLTERVGERRSVELDVLDAGLLRRAVAGLATNQRLVLELAYGEGMSQTEIASRLRRPVGTVKTWARTGLRVLRERLDVQALSA